MLIGAVLALAGFVGGAPAHLHCKGSFEQGALLACRTAPGTRLSLKDGGEFSQDVIADEQGLAVLGFSRDAAAEQTLTVCNAQKACKDHVLVLAPHDYNIERIDGLPPGKVSSFTPAQLDHIGKSSIKKKAAFAAKISANGVAAGFAAPVQGARISGLYGSQRVLNGEPKRPHMGMDFAVPEGTSIGAPSAGIVTLADPDLYFEGGTVFLDHGQGLVSVFMHMSAVDVKAGQHVEKGEVLGKVGATGRATGPHLHWSLKWQNRYYVNPQAALELELPN